METQEVVVVIKQLLWLSGNVIDEKINENQKNPGVDVMITTYCVYRQFLALKNWRFSQKRIL
jgi:hypothetical protein